MRKFNLKGIVAKKLSGVQQDTPPAPAADASQLPEVSVDEETGFTVVWRTDVGRLRRNNQDAVIIGAGLAGVADGMGGHNGGETASSGLRDGLKRELENCDPDPDKLKEAVQKVNLELWNQQENDATLTGMGTTMTVAWPMPEEMLIAHVGDSRCYLIRDGVMEQVTNDHSMVADMVRKGVLTEEQAACHPMRNYITRAVGTEDTIDVDMIRLPRKTGDRWLICSDGLHGEVRKEELERLARTEDIAEAANRLLQAALNNGGKDNISLVLMQDIRKEAGEESPAEDPAEKPETVPDTGNGEEAPQ